MVLRSDVGAEEHMRILVLGATGYIGGASARSLRARNHGVVGLARSDEAAGRLEAAGFGVARGDLTDGRSLVAAAAAADGVVHAGFDRENMAAAIQSSVFTLLGALEGTAKPFIYCGGTLIYGDTGADVVPDTERRTPPAFVTWAPVEDAILAAGDKGVRSVVVRSPLLYGRGGGAMLPGFIATSRQRGVGVHIGDGSNRWSATHIDDVGSLVALAVERAKSGSVFVPASGQEPSLGEIAVSISRLIGADGRTEAWPVHEAAAAMGDWAYGIVLNQRFSTRAGELLDWRPSGPSIGDDIEHGSYRPA
jgi:nucleoside-diphosphate-sugar epimerase